MRKAVILLIAIMFLLGMTAAGGELSSRFHKIVAEYYETDFDDVTALSESGITDDDLAAVYFISKITGTSPKKLADRRLKKDSWEKITKSQDVVATDFFVLIMADVKSKVYVPIFQKFKETAEENWKKISLTDEDIINLVNLKFLSNYHDLSVFKVMEMRDLGIGFARINHDITIMKLEIISVEDSK